LSSSRYDLAAQLGRLEERRSIGPREQLEERDLASGKRYANECVALATRFYFSGPVKRQTIERFVRRA
jgi:hypothetical protein